MLFKKISFCSREKGLKVAETQLRNKKNRETPIIIKKECNMEKYIKENLFKINSKTSSNNGKLVKILGNTKNDEIVKVALLIITDSKENNKEFILQETEKPFYIKKNSLEKITTVDIIRNLDDETLKKLLKKKYKKIIRNIFKQD